MFAHEPDQCNAAPQTGAAIPRSEAVSTIEAVTGRQDAVLCYGACPCPVGFMFLAWTEDGICKLEFFDSDSRRQLQAWRDGLQRDWPQARPAHDPQGAQVITARVFRIRGQGAGDSRAQPGFRLLARGADFQLRVWRAALEIPPGSVLSYQQLAVRVGCPGGARAVGGALAANSIAYLVPCHRVLLATGGPGGYRWGTKRKQALLDWDARFAGAAAPA